MTGEVRRAGTKAPLYESEKVAISILVDEAESYISAVGAEDDSIGKIRWAARIAKRLIGEEAAQRVET